MAIMTGIHIRYNRILGITNQITAALQSR